VTHRALHKHHVPSRMAVPDFDLIREVKRGTVGEIFTPAPPGRNRRMSYLRVG